MTDLWLYAVAALALISWLLAVVEMIGTVFFWRWVFGLGPRIFSEERAFARSLIRLPDGGFATRSATFRVVSPSELLFRPKLFRFHSSLFKGTLTLLGERAIAQGRVSLGFLLFMLVWLALWSFGSFQVVARSADVRNDTGIPTPLFALAGYAFVAGIVWLTIGLARRGARRAVEEFVQRDTA